MAAAFRPPVSNTLKPEIPKWTPPEPTKLNLDWADLHTIELALLHSPDPDVVAKLVATTKQAIKDDGFLFLTDYGVSLEDLHRQFDLAQFLHRNITEEEKKKYLWDPSTGVFAGFKPGTGWKREAGKHDGIEQFNFYSPELEDLNKVPKCIRPFMDEITAFCEYMEQSVTRRLLRLLSLVLELPDNWLWNNIQSHGGVVGEGYFRHALFYPLGEHQPSTQGVRMYGHADYGTTTLLFSVPIIALQILGNDNKWRYVNYKPGALVINLGQSLEIVSGGHFKATLHKVAEPPEDQRHEQRLSLVLFNGSKGDIRLQPALESPLLQREGYIRRGAGVFHEFQKLMNAGVPVPTNKEWREANISTRVQAPPEERIGGIKDIDGVQYGHDIIMGVPVVLPA